MDSILLLGFTQLISVLFLWWKSELNAKSIRNNAAQVSVDQSAVETKKDAIVVGLAEDFRTLQKQQYDAALREIATAKEKTDSMAALALVQAKLDAALLELKTVRAQLTEANNQITRLLALQSGTSKDQTEKDFAADSIAAHSMPEAIPPVEAPVMSVSDPQVTV